MDGIKEGIKENIFKIKNRLDEVVVVTNLEANFRRTKDVGIQTEEEGAIGRQTTAQEIRASIRVKLDEEELNRITEKDWPEEVYDNRIDKKFITSPEVKGNIVILAPVDRMKELKFVKQLAESRGLHNYIESGKLREDEVVVRKAADWTIFGQHEEKEEGDVIFAILPKEQKRQSWKLYEILSALKDTVEASSGAPCGGVISSSQA
ncbi:hypothetical protein WA026_021984 [Henosepilachna vigintioctopunctata]|uniref:Uncharacterized protein n=1 Tax=Henosepilachna vigintioctopunctata TaxID=420089 RepID=A0AAW1VHV1_9CUCU